MLDKRRFIGPGDGKLKLYTHKLPIVRVHHSMTFLLPDVKFIRMVLDRCRGVHDLELNKV